MPTDAESAALFALLVAARIGAVQHDMGYVVPGDVHYALEDTADDWDSLWSSNRDKLSEHLGPIAARLVAMIESGVRHQVAKELRAEATFDGTSGFSRAYVDGYRNALLNAADDVTEVHDAE